MLRKLDTGCWHHGHFTWPRCLTVIDTESSFFWHPSSANYSWLTWKDDSWSSRCTWRMRLLNFGVEYEDMVMNTMGCPPCGLDKGIDQRPSWNRFFVPRLFNVLQALRLSFYSTLGCSLLKDLCLVFIWWSGHSSFTWCSVFWTSGSWGFYMLQFGMHFCLEDFIYDLVINILVLTPRHFCVAGVLRFFRWKFWGTMGCFAEQWLWRYCDYTDFLIVFLPMMCWFLQNAAIQ